MPPRGDIAKHIVQRVYQARKADPGLTFKQAAHELGISPSSLSKLRSGERTGRGSIKTRVIDAPKRGDGQPQSVVNEFTVKFRSADGTRVASRNIRIEGARSRADALLLKHDPKMKRAVQHQLEQEERAEARRVIGSPVWRRKQRQRLEVTEVHRTVRASTPSTLIKYTPTR